MTHPALRPSAPRRNPSEPGSGAPAARRGARVRAGRRGLLAVLVCLGLGAGGACAQDAPPAGAGAMVESSDPQLRALAGALLRDLAERSGMELREPVRLEKRSRAELVRYLEHKLDEELSPEEARETVAAYHLLGLASEDLDLRSVLLDLYTEQVAGFYEPDSTALFILDDQPAPSLQGLLIHELVHAVQDQSAELDVITDPELGNDRATAAQAAIEGHATLVMLEFLAEQQRGSAVDLATLPDFGAALRPALEGMRAQFPALADAPPVIQEALLFPYLEGTGFVQGMWAESGRVAPFGDRLPLSTEQVLTGDLSDEPVSLALDVPGWDVVEADGLGRLELGILLETHAGAAGSAAATGWGGDRWALLRGPEGAQGLVLATAWDDAAARDRFVAALRPALGAFPREAVLEAAESDAGPLAVLRVGVPASVPVAVTRAGGS